MVAVHVNLLAYHSGPPDLKATQLRENILAHQWHSETHRKSSLWQPPICLSCQWRATQYRKPAMHAVISGP